MHYIDLFSQIQCIPLTNIECCKKNYTDRFFKQRLAPLIQIVCCVLLPVSSECCYLKQDDPHINWAGCFFVTEHPFAYSTTLQNTQNKPKPYIVTSVGLFVTVKCWGKGRNNSKHEIKHFVEQPWPQARAGWRGGGGHKRGAGGAGHKRSYINLVSHLFFFVTCGTPGVCFDDTFVH